MTELKTLTRSSIIPEIIDNSGNHRILMLIAVIYLLVVPYKENQIIIIKYILG